MLSPTRASITCSAIRYSAILLSSSRQHWPIPTLNLRIPEPPQPWEYPQTSFGTLRARRYVNSGRIVSQPIRRSGEQWGTFNAVAEVPEGTSLKFFVIDPHTPELQQEVTPGQDLSSLTAQTISLEVQLQASAAGDQTPVLYSWEIR